VLREDFVDEPALSDDLLGLDLDVDRLPADLAVGLVDEDARVREGVALAAVPPARITAAAEAAYPTHHVATSHDTVCMVS